MAVIGVGLDVVALDRLARALDVSPRLAARLFAPSELGLPLRSLAGRFAAKEALAKALTTPGNLSWQDAWVEVSPTGAPRLAYSGTVAERIAQLGVTGVHLAMTHDAGLAAATVIIER